MSKGHAESEAWDAAATGRQRCPRGRRSSHVEEEEEAFWA